MHSDILDFLCREVIHWAPGRILLFREREIENVLNNPEEIRKVFSKSRLKCSGTYTHTFSPCHPWDLNMDFKCANQRCIIKGPHCTFISQWPIRLWGSSIAVSSITFHFWPWLSPSGMPWLITCVIMALLFGQDGWESLRDAQAQCTFYSWSDSLGHQTWSYTHPPQSEQIQFKAGCGFLCISIDSKHNKSVVFLSRAHEIWSVYNIKNEVED